MALLRHAMFVQQSLLCAAQFQITAIDKSKAPHFSSKQRLFVRIRGEIGLFAVQYKAGFAKH